MSSRQLYRRFHSLSASLKIRAAESLPAPPDGLSRRGGGSAVPADIAM